MRALRCILLIMALMVVSAALGVAGSRQGTDLPPGTVPLRPHGGSGLATLLNIQMPENFRAFAPDPDGEDSYPIVIYSWLLLYQRYDNPQKVAALKVYITWCLIGG